MTSVLLIGASGDLGRAVATLLLDRGYDVLGSVVDQQDLERTAAAVPGLKKLFIANFANAEEGKAQLEARLAEGGEQIAALIGCAGISPYGPAESFDLARFRQAFEINVLANLAAYQAVVPSLRATTGKVILLSSLSGEVGLPLLGCYTATKYALEGLSDVIRREAAQWGVSVSLIQPGPVKTAMVARFRESLDLTLASLPAAQQDNYRELFEQHKNLSSGHDGHHLPVQDIAEQVLEVLEGNAPKARYPMGSAVELIGKSRALSDADMDVVIRTFLPGSARVA